MTPRTSRPAKTGQASALVLGELELDRDRIVEAALDRLDRVLLQRAEAGGGEIAGDAAHAEAVGPVRRDGDLDHRIVEAERLGGGAADLGVRRASSMMPVCSSESSSSRSESIMPFDSTPRILALVSVMSVPGT